MMRGDFTGEKEDKCEHERVRAEGGSSESVCVYDDDAVRVRVQVRRAIEGGFTTSKGFCGWAICACCKSGRFGIVRVSS
jgi:hypothetical protein